jgi:hypothetical protein
MGWFKKDEVEVVLNREVVDKEVIELNVIGNYKYKVNSKLGD